MRLVHILLRSDDRGRTLPADTEALLAASAVDADGFELAVVHLRERAHPVVGMYMRTASLEAAEERAAAIWRSAAAAHPQLRPWTLARAEVPLLPFDLD
ncbi:hypothetical protein GCM10010302_07050 [Streptomyces polychromogenes]|uniref:Stress-response A/B barrel domain-containing protein n=1 Tax=Streptomyces polychromogenes TaxID=67342 RepID=A0ABP3ENY7_9ACTN